jgi:8-oxo-dGTP pyrophosphatase MutT (NUDIX family)
LTRRGRETAAAVLIPIVGGDVVLVRRSDELSRHAGQYAFPGGAVEPGDSGPVAAALRESWEEVGLEPGRVEVLGLMDDFRTPTGFVITPVVGAVGPGPELHPASGEVAEVVPIPLLHLLRADAFTRVTRQARGLLVHGDALLWEGRVVWGATARMLLALRRATSLWVSARGGSCP